MAKIVAFFRDVRVELAKVTWPTRQELVRYTLIVIGMTVVLSIFLGFWDFVFQYVLQHYILK